MADEGRYVVAQLRSQQPIARGHQFPSSFHVIWTHFEDVHHLFYDFRIILELSRRVKMLPSVRTCTR